ncbi:MAG: PDZ domain-containing protein [Coprococcus sp.]
MTLPAMQAGIQNGDVITEINKTDITGIAGSSSTDGRSRNRCTDQDQRQRRGADGYVDVTFDVTVGSKE